ncbi:MAG: DUF4469 domain-containing protein [Microcoleaceae cyanobacterium]
MPSPSSNGVETRATVVGQNKPSTLMFMNPGTLTNGDYLLEVRALTGQDIRSGQLENTLSVA